jgi:hypothetical protein
MKIKYVKLECQCKKMGLAQIFLNNEGTIRYERIRHFSHKDAISHKPQLTYPKIDNLDALKDLLKSHNISLDTEKALSGQLGQSKSKEVRDLLKPENSLISKIYAAVV